MIPLITREISFGQNVSELVFVVDVLDLDFWVQVYSIEQPIKRNSAGPGNMYHCGTPSLNDHFDHSFIVLKHIQQSFLMRKNGRLRNTISVIQNVDNSFEIACLARDLCHSSQRVAPFYRGSELCFQGLKTIRSHKC